MIKKRGLGKSLDALLSYKVAGQPNEPTFSSDTLQDLPLAKVHPGKYQPRKEMDPQSLQELADSIRAQGVIQPIIVRPQDKGYEIIAGERRWRAAALAGLSDIPAIIRDVSDETAIAFALIENIQREELNPIEEAAALLRLIEEFGMTHQRVAEAVGKSRTTVTNLLRLLSLPEAIKKMLCSGNLEMGHARALIPLAESLQIELAKQVSDQQLSVRALERLIKRLEQGKNNRDPKKMIDPNIRLLGERLSAQFNTPISIFNNTRGRGRIVIKYRNLTELDRLLNQLESLS